MKRPTKAAEDPDETAPLISAPVASTDNDEMEKGKPVVVSSSSKDSTLSKSLDDEEADDAWMLNVWALPNLAIPLSYFCVGFALNFMSTPLTYYMVHELDATPAQQNVIRTVQALPWSFKLLYGFLSDCYPIMGMRRKPYFGAGWLLYILCNLVLAYLGQPNVEWLTGLLFVGTVGYMMADVMTDAIVVERSKHEDESKRGSIQAQGYIIRFVGSILGSGMGALLYNKDHWGWGLTIPQVFSLNAFVPLIILMPVLPLLKETCENTVPRPIVEQCIEIWTAVQKRNIWEPMIFIYLYNVFQIPNAAWSSFLIDGIHMSDFQLGLISISGSVFSWVGLVVYKKFFFRSNWRAIYLWTTIFTMFFSILQLLLIFRINRKFGLGDLAFALGDDAAAEFIGAIQFLPMVIMYIGLCPEGVEGTTYAMLTTMSNVASATAFDIGTLMTKIWDVSNAAMERHDYAGMWKLTLLTSVLQILPMVLIKLIPGSPAEQKLLQQSNESWFWGGFVFLAVLFFSLSWTVVEAIYEIYV
mmetsp:Transcript_17770/g.25927  ORF Transcript_17770/g.25927 Transcript_17770/m.25927 type:complete len:527 (-) Transcript_17770:480-2060(-)